jgi:hypothetical protein
MAETPFDNIESAHEYVRLLAETIHEVMAEVGEDIEVARGSGFNRRAEALQLVQFKMAKLNEHMTSGCRILNDLRTLRRLLLEEREQHAKVAAAHGD